MAIFDHSEFIPVFLGKIVGKNSEWPFWLFQIYTSPFGENCQKIECNGLESNEKFFGKKLSEKAFLSKKIL